MRPQIACRPCSPRAWSSSEQEARVRKKSLAGEAKGAANKRQAPFQGAASKGECRPIPRDHRHQGLLAAASAFLVTRIALGIVGIGFFGRIWMLLSAGFLFGLVVGLTWIHRFAHGSLLLDAQSQRSGGCRRGISVRMLWGDGKLQCRPRRHLADDRLHFFWLQAGLHLIVNGSLGPSRQACQVTGKQALEEKLVAGHRVPSMHAQKLRS